MLALFGKKKSAAQKHYAAFIADGADQGERPELVGGGLLRSLTGQSNQSSQIDDSRQASDERILGDGDFVEAILKEAEEQFSIRQQYQMAGFGLVELADSVASLLNIDSSKVRATGKQPEKVQARSLFCYWAVRELGYTATALARDLKISQPAVSQAVQRGEILVAKQGWNLRKLIIL